MSFQEVPSYEDRLTFRLYPPHASQTNDTNVLLELKSVINKIHDPDFLREMAIPRDQKLYQTARLYADNYNVSETCREHWNRTIAGLTRNEFWAIKSKGVKCLSKFYVLKRLYHNTVCLFSRAVLDAGGKIGPGILEGNTKWLGSYDECFRIDRSFPGLPPSNSGFETQFCGLKTNVKISFIPLEVSFSPFLPSSQNVSFECRDSHLNHLVDSIG